MSLRNKIIFIMLCRSAGGGHDDKVPPPVHMSTPKLGQEQTTSQFLKRPSGDSGHTYSNLYRLIFFFCGVNPRVHMHVYLRVRVCFSLSGPLCSA